MRARSHLSRISNRLHLLSSARYRHKTVPTRVSHTVTTAPTTNTIRPFVSCCHHQFPHHHDHTEEEPHCKKDNHHDAKPGVTDTDSAYEIKANHFKYGPGVLKELGMDCVRVLNNTKERPRIAIYTDKGVRNMEFFEISLRSIKTFVPHAQILIYDSVEVEPTDISYQEAIQFAKEHDPIDLYVSIGGGSVMDTAKAVNLYT
jgi:hydroxyacid-oxoacid transhydrogenase